MQRATDAQAKQIVSEYNSTVYGTDAHKRAHKMLLHITREQGEKYGLDLFRPFDNMVAGAQA